MTASSGRLDTRPLLCTSASASLDTFLSETSLPSQTIRHSRGIRTGLKLPNVEVSSGSLGQGLSIAVGMALARKLDGDKHSVFCIMGDGEQQEGNIWEAAMEASHFKLNNLVAIIDRNRLQIDGWVKDVMNVELLDERHRSFGREVIEVDGHDLAQVVDGLQKAKKVTVSGEPAVINMHTMKPISMQLPLCARLRRRA